jgi:hypothetical protein
LRSFWTRHSKARNSLVSALQGVSQADEDALKAALNIKTIRDLAENKFVLWAQAITNLAGKKP